MTTTAAQFGAIQNGANSNSLVNQLFAGKNAATSAVKSPNAPVGNPSIAAGLSIGPQGQVQTPSNAQVASLMTSALPKTPTLGSLGTTPVVKHTIGADGSQSVTHAAPEPPPATNPSIVGNAVIPTVPAGTPAPQSTSPTSTQTSASQQTPANLPGIIGSLSNFNPFANPSVSGAYTKAQDLQTELDKSRTNEANALATNDLNPIPIGDQQGRAAVLQNQYLAQQNALAQEEAGQASIYQGGFTGTGQQATALGAAGTLSTPSNQFIQVPYSNQVLDANGQPVGGGTTGTLPAQAQTFVNSLATQVQNGQMTRDEATSQLSAYGPAGLQALNTALGPTFNTNASNASAATTATGQQLQTQSAAANQALDTLQEQFSKLGTLTGSTGFQPLNSIEQSIASLFGNDAVSQYQTTLQEARAKISGVLAASGGVTPTTADEMAKTYLPDGMTPSQLPAKIAAAKTLIQQSVSSFVNSGQQNSSPSSSLTGSLYAW